MAAIAAGYFAGAIPFCNLAARLARGVDLRDFGTGTVSGTSLYRLAGFRPLAAAGILEVGKGAVGPLLARDRPVVAAIAGGAAVTGHNWSPFLAGAGGRGVSPAMGALAVTAWPGGLVLLAGLTFGRLGRRTATGSLIADVALVPFLARVGGRSAALSGAAVVAPLIVKRLTGNGPPERRSLSVYLARLLHDSDRWREE